MEMEPLVNLMLNAGVTVAVIVYFMYRDNKFMLELQKTLTSVKDSLDVINKLLLDEREKHEKDLVN